MAVGTLNVPGTRNAIRALLHDDEAGKYSNLDSILLWKDGRLGFEMYNRRARVNGPHYAMSITKTLTSITLARAILRDPSILILDEATSAIDASSEDKIHEVLQDFVCDRTVLMITHSMAPGVLELVTRVVVMDNGRIIATGRHEDLLQSCPIYRQAYYSRIHVDTDAA